VTERPILFSSPMVKAILEGRKTQTRRALRDQQPVDFGSAKYGAHLVRRDVHDHGKLVGHRMAPVRCPYGQPGDRLWVRETFNDDRKETIYRADGDMPGEWFDAGSKWRPAIHMPRNRSRLTLEVTGVRVERVQSISDADVLAEGCEERLGRHVPAYIQLWDSLNAKRGYGWEKNPWVWVVEFKRVAA